MDVGVESGLLDLVLSSIECLGRTLLRRYIDLHFRQVDNFRRRGRLGDYLGRDPCWLHVLLVDFVFDSGTPETSAPEGRRIGRVDDRLRGGYGRMNGLG